jgi:uncharacterized cupin superfamily protein
VTDVFQPDFEPGERPAGFGARRARIGYELESELIGASLWEVPPGEAAYPYHFHYGDEELRFPLGEDGVHQILNRSAETATFLAISSSGRPDIVVYPDSDKIGVGERLSRGGGLRGFFRRGDAVDYFEGESGPAEPGE